VDVLSVSSLVILISERSSNTPRPFIIQIFQLSAGTDESCSFITTLLIFNDVLQLIPKNPNGKDLAAMLDDTNKRS